MDSDEAKEMFGNNLSETLELGKEHAKQKAQIDYLKEAQKNLLADLMKDIEGPVSTREMNARTDARYINFCTNFRTAILLRFFFLYFIMNFL